MDIITGFLEQGFIFAIMSLGIYITYKILDFPDLTVDGSFPLGAAVSAIMISKGVNPWLSLIIAIAAGLLAGAFTGLIHIKFGVKDLLSGIITMTALYSVNLRIAGTSNLPIFNGKTIFNSGFGELIGNLFPGYSVLILAFVIVFVVKLLMDWYLSTKSGMLLRAVGDNNTFVTYLGRDQGKVKILGLAIANGLAALSGAVLCQQQKVFEISMGTGILVMGLAMVIIGTNFLKNRSAVKQTTLVILGAIIYRACISLVLLVGIEPTDMKILTAILLLIVLFAGKKKAKGGKTNAKA